MNGLMMGGRNIKVERGRVQLQLGRPQTMPQAQPIIDMIMTEARKYHRIYVASVHEDLNENDLRTVFSSFGNIIKCQLAKSTSGKHRLVYITVLDKSVIFWGFQRIWLYRI